MKTKPFTCPECGHVCNVSTECKSAACPVCTRVFPVTHPAPALDTFTRAYIECALWSSTDNTDESGGEPLDRKYSAKDIAPDTLQRMVEDCAAFQSDNAQLLEAAYADEDLPVNLTSARMGGSGSAGHDFWLTRAGHGAGFWDGDWDVIADGGAQYGQRLTDAAKAYGTFDLYVGDDGIVHGS